MEHGDRGTGEHFLLNQGRLVGSCLVVWQTTAWKAISEVVEESGWWRVGALDTPGGYDGQKGWRWSVGSGGGGELSPWADT